MPRAGVRCAIRMQQVSDLWIPMGRLMTGDILFGRLGKDGVPGETHSV